MGEVNGRLINTKNLTGRLSGGNNIKGKLSNAILRGESVQLRLYENMLQFKYENEEEWTDLVDLNLIKQDVFNEVDNSFNALSNFELEELLR